MFAQSRMLSRSLAVALLVLIVAVVVFGVGEPLLQQKNGYSAAAARHERLIADYATRRVDKAALKASLDRVRRDQATRTAFIIAKNATLAAAGIQGRVRRLVENAGGKVMSSQILKPDSTELFEKVTVRGNMRTTIETLQKVLYRLEADKPFLFVDNILIRTSPRQATRRNRARARARVRTRTGAGTMEEGILNVRFEVSGYLWGTRKK